jgi:hypothetical protein
VSRRAGAIPLGFIAGAILLAACVDIPTGADEVLSMQVNPLPWPSVVVGDTLRDSTGVVRPVSVTAFNFSGDLITTPEVRFSALDRGIRVDSLTGVVVGDSIRSAARILAKLNGLTPTTNIAVTLRPDTVTLFNGRDSLSYSIADTTSNLSPALGVRVLHGATLDSGVVAWFVSFRILSPTTAGLAQLVDDNRRASSADTTDATGVASRRIKLDPTKLVSAVDSVIVQASIKYRGISVKGSPARLVLKVKPK